MHLAPTDGDVATEKISSEVSHLHFGDDGLAALGVVPEIGRALQLLDLLQAVLLGGIVKDSPSADRVG